MKVIADSWNQGDPKFGETVSVGFDYRVFLQDEQWLSDGAYSDLAIMTPDDLFRALETLFCDTERYYRGMLCWYEDEYHKALDNDLLTEGNLIGFLYDYQQILMKSPHEWLRDSLLCQGIETCLTENNN